MTAAQTPSQPNAYLKTKVLTASPAELRLMLYEGAIKFCRQARHALGHNDYEGVYNGLTRAQNIVLELTNSIQPDQNPELCEKLQALYNYIYRRLIDASMDRDAKAIDESIQLLEYERETWQMLMKKLGEEEGQAHAAPPPAADNDNPIGRIDPNRQAMPYGPTGTTGNGGFNVQG